MIAVGMGMVGAAYFAATCSAAMPLKGPAEVEMLEDDVAYVVDLKTGDGVEVDCKSLPPRVREGDVIVNGQVDAPLTRWYREQLQELHDRVVTPSNGGFDL
jgi:hypothetical protein